MPPHSAGLAPATRVASRKLGPVAGGRSPPSASSAWADEDVGHDVRQVADGGHHAVVDVGVDHGGPRAEPGEQPVQALEQGALGRRGRGQVPGGAVEEVLARVLDAGRLRARQRVAADEARVARRVDDRALGRADVGDDGAARRLLEDRGHRVGQHVDRHGDEDRVGAVERVAEVAVGAVDRPARDGLVGAGVEPAHRRAEAGAGGQSDRPADEPHPDDRDDQAPTKAALPATAAAACTRAA